MGWFDDLRDIVHGRPVHHRRLVIFGLSLGLVLSAAVFGYAVMQITLCAEAYIQPGWDRHVELMGEIRFPSPMVCPSAGTKSRFDKVAPTGCTWLASNATDVHNCSWSTVETRYGSCLLFNKDGLAVAGNADESRLIITMDVSDTGPLSDYWARVSLLDPEHPSWNIKSKFEPAFYISLTGQYTVYAVIQKEEVRFMNGTHFNQFSAIPSTAYHGILSSKEIRMTLAYQSFYVVEDVESVQFDWLDAIGQIGGALSAASVTHTCVMFVLWRWVGHKQKKERSQRIRTLSGYEEGGHSSSDESDSAYRSKRRPLLHAI